MSRSPCNREKMLCASLTALLITCVVAGTVRAAPSSPEMVLLDGVDGIAFDQPRAIYEFRIPDDPPGTGEIVGPELKYPALLDTGAQAILLEEKAYLDANFTIDPDLYEQETRDDGSLVYYEELGVAGTQELELYVPHDMLLAEDDGVVADVLPAVRMIGDSSLRFGSFSAILGTPAMVDRVSILDLTPMAGEELDFLDTEFATVAPPVTADSYHIDFGKLPPDPTSGRIEPDDPPPTLEALPEIEDATVRHGSLATQRDLIVDTGGQLSIISLDTALSVGIDPEEDAVDYLEVGGIGGQTLMPIVALDEITVPTREGIDLVFRDWGVGVLDIAGIDGVFGMNALTAGYFDAYNTADPDDRGWFDAVVFDFTQDTWVMRLDMNPLYNNPVPVPEPTSLALLGAGTLLLLTRRRRSPRDAAVQAS